MYMYVYIYIYIYIHIYIHTCIYLWSLDPDMNTGQRDEIGVAVGSWL